MKNNSFAIVLSVISVILLSIPWLIPHTGALVLVGFVPLLLAELVARETKLKRFWLYYTLTFVAWNAVTTFWVSWATIGGGIFAVLANAAQMSLIFALFRLSHKVFKKGCLPYIFLAVLWISWERFYFVADISWPWLTLGNAFAMSTSLVQWYEYTGALGGSLWAWICNLMFFALLASLLSGYWRKTSLVAKIAALFGVTALVVAPLLISKNIYSNYQPEYEGSVDVLIAQPNIDPYNKFENLNQAQQDGILLSLFEKALAQEPVPEGGKLLLMGPETFTSGLLLNYPYGSDSVFRLHDFVRKHPGTELLFGASAYTRIDTRSKPSPLAREYGNSWLLSHNVSIVIEPDTLVLDNIHYKNKLVVGVESTPYPKIFVPVDNWLSGLMGVSGLMGRLSGKGEAEVNYFDGVPFGCAICYESVYGDYCREFVKNGAQFMTVITNDSWWGNTPGYRQHFNYARLRAIELRRDFARCGNSGLSGFIDSRGDVVEVGPWWEEYYMRGNVFLNSEQTFFVRYGDLTGLVSSIATLALVLLAILKLLFHKR